MGLGRYGKVFTVLVSNTIGQDDDPGDDENDDELIESCATASKINCKASE